MADIRIITQDTLYGNSNTTVVYPVTVGDAVFLDKDVTVTKALRSKLNISDFINKEFIDSLFDGSLDISTLKWEEDNEGDFNIGNKGCDCESIPQEILYNLVNT